jgi:hypothetical protein
MIKLSNKGKEILETNYWDSEYAQEGIYYLSWNAGAARLLVPDSKKSDINEMKSAKYVIISRGTWLEHKKNDALELLFEDNSESPFCLFLSPEQTDRLLPDTDEGGNFVTTVWTRDGQKLELQGKYRKVESIPCLQPWK